MFFVFKRYISILTCFLTLFWVEGCGGGFSKVLEKEGSSELKGVHYKEIGGDYLLRDECDALAASSQCKFEICSLVTGTTEVLEGSCTAAFLDSQGKAVWVKDRDLRAWLQHESKHTYSLHIEPTFSVKGFATFGAGSVGAGVVYSTTRFIVGASAVSFLGRDLKEYGGKSGALIHEYCLPVVDDDESGEIAVECEEL